MVEMTLFINSVGVVKRTCIKELFNVGKINLVGHGFVECRHSKFLKKMNIKFINII